MRAILLLIPMVVPCTIAQEPPDFAVTLRPLLSTYCHACHAGEKAEAGVALDGVKSGEQIHESPETWQEVVRQVRGGFMPPKKAKKRPTAAERLTLADGIETWLSQRGPGGPVTMRRLNAVEYSNTVFDLLGTRVDPKRLPADPTAYGFDNIGDALFVSPLLVERYYELTKQVVRRVLSNEEKRHGVLPHAPTPQSSAGIAARRNLELLLPRAFRRPPSEEEITTRVGIVTQALEGGVNWDAAMSAAIESVLLSPHFIFRVEGRADAPAGRHALTDHELAVRLSYFLWSTMPDAELRRRADDGELRKPEVLRAEVERMLNDPRSRALADNFAGQWLRFREIRDHAVDYRRFLWLDNVLRHAMYEESALTFDAIVREDRPITELLDANTIFVNQRLAKHYGIDGVQGGAMRRVPVGKNRRRGGVLGMASILTVTSFPLRTSPVVRGKWVLEVLLGTPPPPPPPDVGTLPDDDKQKDGLTLRERLEKHRSEPRCASCHASMDPYGLALERFDGVGRWRDAVHGKPVDSRTTLPDGTVVDGPVGLKDSLLAQRDQFTTALVERFFIYAIGRDVEASDRPAVRAIAQDARKGGYRLRSIIQGVIASEAFRFRIVR